MKIDPFEMEHTQSTRERVVEMDLGESGARPVSLREPAEMGLDSEAILDMPLGYSQSNGALCLVAYRSAAPGTELCERIRVDLTCYRRQGAPIVPGAQLGREGCVRLWLGGEPGGAELGKEASRG